MRSWVPRVLQGIWWVSVLWLALAGVGMGYWFFKWLSDADNPYRYEYAFGAAMVLLYSWPAGLGMTVAGVYPRTGLSNLRRIVGLALMLFDIGFFILFDFLQARH